MTLEQALADHWGRNWEPRRTELIAAGIDLSASVDQEALHTGPTLDEVLGEVVAALDGSRDVWIASMIELELGTLGGAEGEGGTTTTLGTVLADLDLFLPEEEAGAAYAELYALATHGFELLVELQRDLIRRGEYQLDYIVAPPRLSGPPGTGHYYSLEKWVRGPWHVSFAMDSTRSPELEATLAEIQSRKQALVGRIRSK